MNISHRTTYKQAMRLFKKLARISLLGAGVYILLPTPDGAIIHPLSGSLLSHIFGMSFMQGIITSIAIYTALGILLCLIGCGKQIYQKLKKQFTRIHQITGNSICSIKSIASIAYVKVRSIELIHLYLE